MGDSSSCANWIGKYNCVEIYCSDFEEITWDEALGMAIPTTATPSSISALPMISMGHLPQFTTRKNDFVKPVKNYKVLEFFGKNIVTLEGEEWRRHKRVVAKSFGEKSIKLVWGESVRQAEGMIRIWGGRGKSSENGDEELRVEDAGSDTATLSLHVICAVGFGVPQLWEGEGEADVDNESLKIEGEEAPNLGLSKPAGEHSLGFKDCINLVFSSILLILIWPQWMLKISPIKRHGQVYKAFKETNQYVAGLLEHKKKQMSAGEYDKVTMDLMGNMLKASTETSDSPTEIKSNAFIFLLAGHETTGSSIQLCFVYLAISILSQTSMQADIDLIVGSKKPRDWTYTRDFPRLYNSMMDCRESGRGRRDDIWDENEDEDEDLVTDEMDSESSPLFKPVKGAFISFSEGPRACPGKKFAQVEMIAVLTVIFQKYSVELDVSRWASDEEVQSMNDEERREVYGKAIRETKEVLGRCNQAQIVLKMAKGDKVPLRFVERGKERFRGL
ncbi:cytochrome p450 3a21 [Botrytis cinerea]